MGVRVPVCVLVNPHPSLAPHLSVQPEVSDVGNGDGTFLN